MKTLTIIAPVYNEEDVIAEFHREVNAVLDTLRDRYECGMLFVVDRCADNTQAVLEGIAENDPNVRCLFLSSRFGHQAALIAGIDHAKADVLIMMDSDLQHPPSVLPELVAKYEDGFDVVLTLREDNEAANLISGVGSALFYKLMDILSDTKITSNAADFRLISAKVARVFREDIRERNQFLRGLFNWVGFRQATVHFHCGKRASGQTKYTFSRRLSFAAQGIISFSKRPLQMAFYGGFVMAACSMLIAVISVVAWFFALATPPGWATLAVGVFFLGSVQLIFLGILGEYIGAIFDEVKGRPHYIVDKDVNPPAGQAE